MVVSPNREPPNNGWFNGYPYFEKNPIWCNSWKYPYPICHDVPWNLYKPSWTSSKTFCFKASTKKNNNFLKQSSKTTHMSSNTAQFQSSLLHGFVPQPWMSHLSVDGRWPQEQTPLQQLEAKQPGNWFTWVRTVQPLVITKCWDGNSFQQVNAEANNNWWVEQLVLISGICQPYGLTIQERTINDLKIVGSNGC